MKISNIVDVNMTNLTNRSFIVQGGNNPTAAVIIAINDSAGTDDLNWIDVNTLLNKYVPVDTVIEPGSDKKKITKDIEALKRLVEVYYDNGGIGLVAKRLYTGSDATINARFVDAVVGNDVTGQVALDNNIINILLVNESWNGGEAISYGSYSILAGNMVSISKDERILMVNVHRDKLDKIVNPDSVDNLVINVFNIKASDGKPATVNNYEVALIAAYVSRINYNSGVIKGLEYTEYASNRNNLNIMKDLPTKVVDDVVTGIGFGVNIITEIINNRYYLVGAQTTDGSNFIGRYFGIVLSQKITNALLMLTLNKLDFSNASYSMISAALKAELDVFGNNKLLNKEFISPVDHKASIHTANGVELFYNIKRSDTLSAGYKVVTLPPSLDDINNKSYSGVYVYYAISDQIRTIHVNGIVLGGI